MISASAKTTFDATRVLKAAKRGSVQSLGRAGAYVRGIAKKSIKVSPEKSAPGKPPHTRKGRLKLGIIFAVERAREAVVIGPSATEVGKIGHTHEFGGTEPPKKRKGRSANWKMQVGGHGPIRFDGDKPVFAKLKTGAQAERAQTIAPHVPAFKGGPVSNKPRVYPPRPFMGPALLIAKDRLPSMWANSVKGD